MIFDKWFTLYAYISSYIFIISKIYNHLFLSYIHQSVSRPYFPKYRLNKCQSTTWVIESVYSGDHLSNFRKVKNGLTSCGLSGLLSITNWIMPRMFPSMDMDLLSVSMASWLDLPRRVSPFTATSWSFTRSRPSWGRGGNSVKQASMVMTGSCWEEKFKYEEERVRNVNLNS